MRVFVAFLVMLAIGCSAVTASDSLAPSFLEAAATHAVATRLPHCSDIVDAYIKLETATAKADTKFPRDWTCAAMANKLWSLLSGHTTTSALDNTTGVTRLLRERATKLAHPQMQAATVTLFNLGTNIVDCDGNNNKVCQCTPAMLTTMRQTTPTASCASKFALRASTFYIVEIGTKGIGQRTYKDALAHLLVVYVHADGTTVSIYQSSAGVTPLIRKTSTLAKFQQGLALLVDKQSATTLTKPESTLLDQFCLIDKKDPTGIKYRKEVVSVAVGGGFSDAHCQTLTGNLPNAKNDICSLICNKAGTTKLITKRTWIIKKVQVEVCDCA